MFRRAKRDRKVSARNERRQEKPQVEDFQPKLLRKQESIEEPEEKKKIEESLKIEVPSMLSGVNLINRNLIDVTALQQYLQHENSNFCVVGVVGMKGSGKTKLMNLLANQELEQCEEHGTLSNENPFAGNFKNGNGVEAFITKSRLVLLDSAPILFNLSCREFMLSETDDHRQLQALFRLCHELIVVYESHQIFSLTRMLVCAKNMMNRDELEMPAISLVENRTQPGDGISEMSKTAKSLLERHGVSDSIFITHIPDFDRISKNREEPLASIQQLREDLIFRKELKAFEDPEETEKKWWEGLIKMSMDGGQFLKDFEALRDKYYQQSEKFFS